MQAMIECPRCGFSQPQDRYCANCGVDMDAILKKPKPLLSRVAQNSTLHLTLIFALIAVVIGWIFYTQRALVSREVGALLDLPLSSRDAADPNAVPEEPEGEAPERSARVNPGVTAERVESETSPMEPAQLDSGRAQDPESAATTTAKAATTGQALDVSFYEVSREGLLQLIPKAKEVGGAYYFAPGEKNLETFKSQSLAVGAPKSAAIAPEAVIEWTTPATAPDNFRFAIQVQQLGKTEAKELNVAWTLMMAVGENASLAESTSPAVALAPQGTLMVVLDAGQRTVKDEWVTKAGDGPWSIFSSPEYKAGITEWVMLIHLK